MAGDPNFQCNQVGGTLSPNVGPAIASAAGVVALGAYAIQHVTGALAVTGWTIPYAGFTGSLVLIPDGAFTTTTATNIGLASTGVVGKAMVIAYDGTKWWPSY